MAGVVMKGWWRDRKPPIFLAAAETLVRPIVRLHDLLYTRGILESAGAKVPVISVGNLAVGGTGKTPCVIWLARELLARGERPVVLTRGFGGRGGGIRVLEEGAALPAYDETGDEPLEIFDAVHVPVVIGRDRRAAARTAVERFRPTCLLLDDGFQHRPIRRDVDLVLLDAALPFGNGHLLPAGPLREPPSALARAQLVLLTRAGEAADPERSIRKVAAVAPGAWIGLADHVPVGLGPITCDGAGRHSGPGSDAPGGSATGGTLASQKPPAGTPVLVVAGIARPESVARAAELLGHEVTGRIDFPDHHRYTVRDLARVIAAAGSRPVVTTAKDVVRWRAVPGFDPAGWWVLRVEFRPRDAERLLAAVLEKIRIGHPGGVPSRSSGDRQ